MAQLQALLLQPRHRRSYVAFLFLLATCGYMWALGHRESVALWLRALLPAEEDKGLSFYVDFVALCLAESLWICIFVLMVWLIAKLKLYRITRSVGLLIERDARPLTILVIATCLGLTILVSFVVLQHFPNSADEYVYLHQAETLSNGRLWNDGSPIPEVFHFNHIADKEGTRVGRFPPGWPLVLSASFATGIPPWVVNPILAIVTLVVFFAFARKLYGVQVAGLSLLLLSMSGYFIYNSASFFSHAWSTLLVLLLVWMTHLYAQSGKPVYALLAGFMLGALILTRYYTALLVFLPIGLYFLHKFQHRIFVPALLILLGLLPGVLFLGWYNHQITGNPILPVTSWAYDNERLGFVNGHNVVRGLEYSVRRLFMFIYWCSPGLLLMYFIFLWKKMTSPGERWTHPEDYVFVFLFVGHFFYYHIGGNQYGPRFVYEALPFMVLFVVRKTFEVRHRLTWAIVLAGLIICLLKLPFISIREATIVEQRKDLFDLVEEAGLEKAVVFIASPTSNIRPMPVEDLTRNDLPIRPGVVFVREIPGLEELVMSYYEGHRFYRYHRHVDSEQGKLTPIR